MAVLPAHRELTCLPVETCRMLWVVGAVAVATPFVVLGMASRGGARRGDVNEGSEMEKGWVEGVEGEGMVLRRGSGGVGL